MSEPVAPRRAVLTLDMLQALPGPQAQADTVVETVPPPEANGHQKKAGGRKLKATNAPQADVEARAKAYLDKLPGGIQGQKGSNPTYWAARVAVYGFDLGVERGLQLLLSEYNRKCQPPWSESELRHKCEDADKQPFDRVRGWLRDSWQIGMPVEQGPKTWPVELPEGIAVTVQASAVRTRRVEWAWLRRIPLGKLTTFAGIMGIGKTFLLCDIAARQSAGTFWPDATQTPIEAGDVLFISGEDEPEDTLVPRLMECGADLKRVRFLSLEALLAFQLDNLKLLDRAADECNNLRIVVIDPPSSYLGDVDDHKNAELRRLLTPLQQWAARRKVAVIFNTHLNKGGNGKVEAIFRVIGSVAWMAAVRAGHLIALDPDDPEKRLFVPMKSNLGKRAPALAYTVKETAEEMARVEWLGEVDVTADQAVNRENKKKKRRVVASEWLEEIFPPGVNQLPSDDVWKLKDQKTNLSNDALKEAKYDMGIRAQKLTDDEGVTKWFWIWSLEDRRRWEQKKQDRQEPPQEEPY